MSKPDVLATLRSHADELREEFDVASLAVFGSAARGDLRPDSDVDVVVTFRARPTLRGYFALEDRLEELLQRPVDLATDRMVKPRLRTRIEDDLTRVA
ncbi:MAG: nucleotidyltransferase family protein [Myxococcota bacterium]